MIIFIICLLIGLYFIYKFYKDNNKDKITKNNLLATDMEIYIAQLEIRPKSNKDIKNVAKYLENIVMPNEKILAVESAWCLLGTNFAIVTDKRVIFENKGNDIMTPIEKIETVIQNGTVVTVNKNWIELLSGDKASKIVNLINKQVSSIQTVGQAIKIENKIVTEETITSQLKKLSDLHDAKVLTDFEYSMKKQELLDKIK